jgi:uncharacterized protein (DUF1697 family)
MNYVALLRGINVGGNTLIKMAELRECLQASGLKNVTTYIQSGNLLFSSDETNTLSLAKKIEKEITNTFGHTVPTVVFGQAQFSRMLANTPQDWCADPKWKYNLLFLIPPYNIDEVLHDIGELKPGIEALVPGPGVMYQAINYKMYGRATSAKIASKPVYKKITIRNPRTGAKLLELLQNM